MTKVSIIVGSESDLDVLEIAKPYLKFFSLPYEIKVLSAHRQHDELVSYIKYIEQTEIEVIIACAGMAAHLPGIIASLTTLPVIGVPLNTSPLNGIDALYSIVQMPRGIPVATMSIGEHGVINAVVYTATILSLQSKLLRKKLSEFRIKGSKLS